MNLIIRKHGFYYVIDYTGRSGQFNLICDPNAKHKWGKEFCDTMWDRFKAGIIYTQPTRDSTRYQSDGLVRTPAFSTAELARTAAEYIEARELAEHMAVNQ